MNEIYPDFTHHLALFWWESRRTIKIWMSISFMIMIAFEIELQVFILIAAKYLYIQ